jgi:hypothetical protein
MRPQSIIVLVLALSSLLAAQGRVTVIAERANLRGTPHQGGKVVSEVTQGDSFETIKQSGPWYLVQTPDYVGWLHGNTIRLSGTIDTLGGVELTPYTYIAPPRPAAQAPVYSAPRTSGSSSGYIRGPRGGCYYINSRGNKTYVSRSLCS